MSTETNIEAHDAVQTAIVEARQEGVATANDIAVAAIEAAEARATEAERVAEAITDAALRAELSQRMDDLRQEFLTWQKEQSPLIAEISNLKNQVAEMTGQIAALGTLQLSSEKISSLPPPASEVVEAKETIAEVIPENLSENVVVENPVPEIEKRKRRWI